MSKKTPIQKLVELHQQCGLEWLKDAIKTIELLTSPKQFRKPRTVKIPEEKVK